MIVANIDKAAGEGLFEEASSKLRTEWAGTSHLGMREQKVQARGMVAVKTLRQERAWHLDLIARPGSDG